MDSYRILSKPVAAVFAILPVVILLAVYFGALDSWLQISTLDKVAEHFEQSYAPHASHPIRPWDAEWAPTIRLIKAYTRVSLPKDRQPRIIGRYVAISSAQEVIGKGQIAEWTAPSTPMLVLYKDWPGNTLAPDDWRIGSIGDFRSWINQYRDKWKFLVDDVLLAFLTLLSAASSLFGEKSGTDREAEFLALC